LIRREVQGRGGGGGCIFLGTRENKFGHLLGRIFLGLLPFGGYTVCVFGILLVSHEELLAGFLGMEGALVDPGFKRLDLPFPWMGWVKVAWVERAREEAGESWQAWAEQERVSGSISIWWLGR
jgi:hypothetical protein